MGRATTMLTSNGEMTQVLAVLTALKKGDSSVRLPTEWTGLAGKIADAFNDVVELNARMAEELAHLSRVVGKEGKLKQRGSLGDVRGFWLEDHAMKIVSADNGRDAISLVGNRTDIDVVLMDIMMPEMDGMDTIREIRKIPECKGLPIIAVTAKAMKGDRERCLEAGAWDYLSKPVDTEQMLAVLRAWLHR